MQIEKFAYLNNWDIIIFPGKYYWIKKDSGNPILRKLLFKAQDKEKNYIKQGLLF